MDIAHQLLIIFCEIDEFCKELDKYFQGRCLPGQSKGQRGLACSLTLSEIDYLDYVSNGPVSRF